MSAARSEAERGALASVSEASKFLGIPRSSLYDAIAREEIPAVRIAGKTRIPWSVLERLAAGEDITKGGDQ